jgi:cell division septation protein DedD
LLLIVSVGLAINSIFLAPARVLGDQTNITVDGLYADTNQQRTANSESVLNLNSQLNSAAQAKANDMVARDYWSHTTPDGQQPWTFITAAGYTYTAAGENLAYGFDSSDAVITGWMNSAEHRANILGTSYKDVGFGIASSSNFVGTGPEIVVVAMYGAQQETNTVNISFSVGTKPTSSPVSTETPAPSDTPAPAPTATQAAPATANPAPTPTPTVAHSATQLSTTRSISRIQLLAQNEAWSTAAVTLIGLGTIAIFLTRHVRFWNRAIRKGEMFVIRHVWFDALIVSVATACYIVSRVAGVIG